MLFSSRLLWVLPVTLVLPQFPIIGQESEPIQKPELVALAWSQPSDVERLEDVRFWNADGEDMDSLVRQELVENMQMFSFRDIRYSQPETIRPLILVFSVDTRLEQCGVLPTLNFGDGRIVVSNSWENRSTNGFVTAKIGTATRVIDRWSGEAELTIRYTPSKPSLIRELTENLDEDQELDDGLWSRIRHNADGAQLEILNTVAETGSQPTATYDVIALHEDGSRIDTLHWSVRREDGVKKMCRASGPIDPDQLARILVFKRGFAYEDLGKIVIRTDLLDKK